MYNFDYLKKKIEDSDFITKPFKHIYIENFFSDSDFNQIINSPQIKIKPVDNPKNLIDTLKNNGWELRAFGGSAANEKAYLNWRNKKTKNFNNVDTCEGFGLTFKSKLTESKFTNDLRSFLSSEEFFFLLRKKFNIPNRKFRIAAGCHKYLDGYEISPHFDSRNKALTYMININPDPKSENSNHHTHYMILKKEYKYISSYIKHNKDFDTPWLPWDWCSTVFQQIKNNSLVIFSPSESTIHAVKAKYDDLKYQRTQFYGNLWYQDKVKPPRIGWESLVINPKFEKRRASIYWRIKNKIFNSRNLK